MPGLAPGIFASRGRSCPYSPSKPPIICPSIGTGIGRDGGRATVIAKYERWLADQHHLLRALDELRGRDLVCFCAPLACHGDLLRRLANATRDERIAWWRGVKAAAGE